MRRKIGILMIMGLLLLGPAMAVCAAPADNDAAEAVSAYCVGNELHAFMQVKEGYDVSKYKVTLESDLTYADREGAVAQLRDTSANVRYMFMIDQSTSMKRYKEQIRAFVESIMDAEDQKAFYTVATFGEQFEVISADQTDKNTVNNVLEQLKYKEQKTDPYTGVESALTYLDGYSIGSGDLIYLVVITDGAPELDIEDKEQSQETERQLAQSLTDRLAETPEIIVGTLCTKEWEESIYQALAAGRGIHEVVQDAEAAREAGAGVAEYVDSLYRVSFRLSEEPEAERFDVELTLKERGADGFRILLENVPNRKLYSHNAQEGQEESGIPGIGGFLRDPDKDKKDSSEAGEPEGSGDKEDPTESESSGDKESLPETEASGGKEEPAKLKEPEDKESPADTANPGDEEGLSDGEEGSKDKEAEKGDEQENGGWNIGLLLSVLGGVLILAGVCVLIFAGKRRSTRAAAPPQAAGQAKSPGAGIAMKLEVYSGRCMSQSAVFYLAEPIVIGSAPECDLVFADTEVAPQNSRIFLKDQMIYIEDLNSAEGTALGGMRIQGQNRLRSGDVISIGDVEFSFKF